MKINSLGHYPTVCIISNSDLRIEHLYLEILYNIGTLCPYSDITINDHKLAVS